jgi:hypothetical protein
MALKPVDLEYFNREEVNIHEAPCRPEMRAAGTKRPDLSSTSALS